MSLHVLLNGRHNNHRKLCITARPTYIHQDILLQKGLGLQIYIKIVH